MPFSMKNTSFINFKSLYLNKKIIFNDETGFTLIEIIIVIVIMGILAQIGMFSFNRYTRKTRAFASRTALRQIQRECETNRDLGMDPVFTLLGLNSYSIETSNTNSCLGEINSGLVSAIPDLPNKYPSYSYDYSEGKIECLYNNTSDNLFKDCISLKSKLESNDFVVKETYVRRGCSNYVWVDGPSWSEAQAQALKIGGNLATINDKEENDFLMNKFKKEALNHMKPSPLSPNDGEGHVLLHIGLTTTTEADPDQPTIPLKGSNKGWISGESSSFRPDYWGVCNQLACGMGTKTDGTGVHTSMIHNYKSEEFGTPVHSANNWNDSPNPIGLGLAEIPVPGCK